MANGDTTKKRGGKPNEKADTPDTFDGGPEPTDDVSGGAEPTPMVGFRAYVGVSGPNQCYALVAGETGFIPQANAETYVSEGKGEILEGKPE